MNSHILIPKCVLKQFADEKQSLHCYHVEKHRYEKKRADSLYTEEDHYSQLVEKYLSDEVEAPLGQLIKKLKRNFGAQSIQLTKDEIMTLKNYVFSLMTRSQEMKTAIDNTIWKPIVKLTPQMLHDLSVVEGMRLAQEKDFLKPYQIAIIECNVDKEFVLPLQGDCDFECFGKTMILIPLTPKIALCFYLDKSLTNTTVNVYPSFYDKVNELSFQKQCSKGYGYVISSKEQIIKDLIKQNPQ